MRVVFELTQEDLTRAQAQTLESRIGRIQQSPLLFFMAAILAGVLCWPLLQLIVAQVPFFADFPLSLPVYLVLYVAGVVVAWFLRNRLGPPKFVRLNAWASRRAGEKAAKRSTLGDVAIELTDAGISVVNAAATATYPFKEVERILRSEALLVLPIAGQGRAVLVPQRAFSSQSDAAAFLQKLEVATGKKAEEVAV